MSCDQLRVGDCAVGDYEKDGLRAVLPNRRKRLLFFYAAEFTRCLVENEKRPISHGSSGHLQSLAYRPIARDLFVQEGWLCRREADCCPA